MKFFSNFLKMVLILGFCGITLSFDNFSSKNTSRSLDGIEFIIITPKEYAKQIKEGEIGTGEKYVIDGLCLSTNEKTVMLQNTGFSNIFTAEESVDLTIGKKVRLYVEVTLVNNVLLSLSEAKIIKMEKL